jgi:hypothetical protein
VVLKCERVVFSGHAIQRMFQRGVGKRRDTEWTKLDLDVRVVLFRQGKRP